MGYLVMVDYIDRVRSEIALLAPEIRAASRARDSLARDYQLVVGALAPLRDASEAIATAEAVVSEARAVGILPKLRPAARPPAPVEERRRVPAPIPSPTKGLDHVLAGRISGGSYGSIRELALEYRPELERLGKVRTDSTDDAAWRRLQEFLSEHVYGKLIRESALPARIRKGRETGGLRGPQHS